MGTPLAIAAVTAVLRARLAGATGGDWTAESARSRVVSMPPDHVVATDETGPLANVFLYSASPDLSARNVPPPAVARPAHQPLLVDLTYLVSAHGVLPLDGDILLGQVLFALQESPMLTADEIRSVLDPSAHDPSGLLPKAFRQEAIKLADEAAAIRVVVRPLTATEAAAYWESLRSPYRPCIIVDVRGVSLG